MSAIRRMMMGLRSGGGSQWDYELRPDGDTGYTGDLIINLNTGDVVTINFNYVALYAWGNCYIYSFYNCNPRAVDADKAARNNYTQDTDYTITVTAIRDGQLCIGTGGSNNVGDKFHGRYINVKIN